MPNNKVNYDWPLANTKCKAGKCMTTTGNQLLCLHGSATIKFRKQVLTFHKQRNRQTDRQTDINRQADINRQTDKQAERRKHTDKNKQASEKGKKIISV